MRPSGSKLFEKKINLLNLTFSQMRDSPIAVENLSRYGKQPTWEMVQDFVDEVGVPVTTFEHFYGLPHRCLGKMKCGDSLSPKYWHIFYERIRMPYGCGFDEVKQWLYKANTHNTGVAPKKEKKGKYSKQKKQKHGRLETIR